FLFFFSSRRRHTRSYGDWSSDVCSSDLQQAFASGETNERALNLAARIAGVRGPTEPVVLDEAFGGEIGWGASEVRAMRYLLGLQIGRASCRERVEVSVGGGGREQRHKEQ